MTQRDRREHKVTHPAIRFVDLSLGLGLVNVGALLLWDWFTTMKRGSDFWCGFVWAHLSACCGAVIMLRCCCHQCHVQKSILVQQPTTYSCHTSTRGRTYYIFTSVLCYRYSFRATTSTSTTTTVCAVLLHAMIRSEGIVVYCCCMRYVVIRRRTGLQVELYGRRSKKAAELMAAAGGKH